METDRKFLAMVTELIESSHSRPTCTNPAEGDMELDCSKVIEKFLPATTHDISIRATNFIECLRDCFNNPDNVLMEFMLETKQWKVYLPLFHYFKLIIIYFFFAGVQIQLGYGTSRYQFSLRGSFVSNHRKFKFHVLSNYKIEAMNVNCINPLEKLASKSSLPVEILPNQTYAV